MELARRDWITCGRSREAEYGGEEGKLVFKVLQWNTLADALSPSGPDSNFFRSPPQCLLWEHRSPRLLAEILRSEADLVCLEEVDHFRDFFLPRLTEHGYAGLWRAKAHSPCLHIQPNNGPDGCALFYRTSHFSLLESLELVLRGPSGVESNQVAILARLQPQDPGLPPVCVAVTHLKAKKGNEDYRLSQGRHLQSEIMEFARGQPVIICGDFNAPPTEPVYLQLSSNEGGLRMSSAYGHDSGEPIFTTWKHRPSMASKHTIDYIWYTPEGLELQGLWSIPSEEEIGETALPSPTYPSDHVSLCASFTLQAAPVQEQPLPLSHTEGQPLPPAQVSPSHLCRDERDGVN